MPFRPGSPGGLECYDGEVQQSVFQKLLLSAIQQGASDVHLQVACPPLLRINGELLEAKYHPLTPPETQAVVEEIVSHSYQKVDLATLCELDLSYSLEGQGRFRVNVFRQRGSFGVVLRIIPITIRSFAELNLPKVMEQISSLRRGLVLVVGATGNGKSTTLASMIEFINAGRRCHVVTIEDPIEFLFKHKRSVITQREIGTDTRSIAEATIAAMRQDPDVIMIGEMRDLPTVEIALNASETGHLVLSSLHTTDALRTVERLIGFYPPDQEPAIRARLADALTCVVALRLLPRKGTPGRIPAIEVLRSTRSIQECIRDPGRTHEIPAQVAKGREVYGMQTFDQHILELLRSDQVDPRAARNAASNPEELERAMMLEG